MDNLTLKFIYALYNNPIYKNCDYDENGKALNISEFKEAINIAIVGFEEYGRAFLDTVLQVGQMPGRKLNVSIYSSNMELEKQTYLADRPAFENFFDVDDKLTDNSYGHIMFKQSKWKENNKTTIEFFDELEKMDYILFTQDNEEDVEKSVGELLKENPFKYKPVLIKAQYLEKFGNIEDKTIFADLERMAFNAHLVWKKSLEIDFSEAKKEFEEEYNYISSLTNVLSIKYKLHSAGIELDNKANVAASEFIKRSNGYDANNKADRRLIDELGAAEHRRWNVEKICSGWQRIELDDITADDAHNKGKTDDEYKKHHYCLVKSGSDNPLANWSGDDWDSKPIDDLDELDKVSVITHRALLKEAENKKAKILLNIAILSNNIPSNCRVAFEDWSTCISLIMDRNASKICKPYSDSYNRLLKVIGRNESIRKSVIEINNDFALIIKSREYDNQKQKDIDLVKQIPFILTYSKDLKLACEFTTGNNSVLFSNVSVLKKYHPIEIIYFCEYSNGLEADIKHFNNCISNYSWLRTKISYVVGYNPIKVKKDKVDAIVNKIKISANILPYNEYFEYITDKIGNDVDAVIYSNSVLGYNLKSNAIRSGKYDGVKGKCDKDGDIGLVAVKFDLSMTIQDILRINGARGHKESTPIYLEKAYSIYKPNKQVWKAMCKKLKKIVDETPNEVNYCIDNIYKSKIKEMIDDLSNAKCGLIELRDKNGKKYIKFHDDSVKTLLTKEGEMLEVHIFNICIASGLFDDVATGYEIKWENGNVTNEFDLLATSGLKSAFAEIKATSEYKEDGKWVSGLKQKYYEKLESLDCKFGINSSEFIINDSVDTKTSDESKKQVIKNNNRQISRGEQFDIKTILKDELEKTPKIIFDKMNGLR